MNIKQTLIIIFFMMFCVAFVPRADAGGYYCRDAGDMYFNSADLYNERNDKVDRLNNIIDNEGKTWADKKRIAENILYHLKWMLDSVSDGSVYGTLKASTDYLREVCPMSSRLKGVMRKNREDSKMLSKRITYWKGTIYAIEKTIEREKERRDLWEAENREFEAMAKQIEELSK